MNLKVLKWLLAHKDALLQIVEVAKAYNKALPYIDQWNIADRIARIVIPILEAEEFAPKALAYDDIWDLAEECKEPPREVQFVAAGYEVSVLGIDWQLITEVIVPLVLAIIRALVKDE